MQDGSNTPSSVAPWNRKRPNSDSDDSSSGPPCKRFQTSLNLAKPHSAPLNLASSSSAGFQVCVYFFGILFLLRNQTSVIVIQYNPDLPRHFPIRVGQNSLHTRNPWITLVIRERIAKLMADDYGVICPGPVSRGYHVSDFTAPKHKNPNQS